MPFCEKCGKEIKDGDRFCTRCGAEVKSLPMTSVNEKPTDIKSDKKSKKKLVVIISAASAVAVVLAVCAIVLLPKMFGNNNAEQAVKATTQQVYNGKFRQQQNLQLLNRLQIFQQRQSLLRLSLQQPSRPSPKHRKMTAKVIRTVTADAILTAFQLKSPRIIHMRLMVIRLLFMNRIITNYPETGSDGIFIRY